MSGRNRAGAEAHRRVAETGRRDVAPKILNPIERATVMATDLARIAAACERTADSLAELVALLRAGQPNSPGTAPARTNQENER